MIFKLVCVSATLFFREFLPRLKKRVLIATILYEYLRDVRRIETKARGNEREKCIEMAKLHQACMGGYLGTYLILPFSLFLAISDPLIFAQNFASHFVHVTKSAAGISKMKHFKLLDFSFDLQV